VNKFEEYDLYIENKSFLQAEQIITFMDMDGTLLALKPDVTLSIVKNIPAGELSSFEKLYYRDEVCRVSRENREYKAISQIGVELVGPADVFAGIEIIDLAMTSLEAIGEKYVLDLSHLGFVSGLLNEAELDLGARKQILSAIHAKSPHVVRGILEEHRCETELTGRILALADIHGELSSVLPQAKALVVNDEMRAACDELIAVANALSDVRYAGHLNLDFSVVNNLDYYNGLIFLGYVEGLPHGLLSGGRYDNLMKRMGKQSGAIGFAVSLDELNTYFRSGRQYDFDLVLTYNEATNAAELLRTVKIIADGGASVRLEREGVDLSAAGFTYRRQCRFEDFGIIGEGGKIHD
jgi:ATP phosphoribosyltransferase regulatory subunit